MDIYIYIYIYMIWIIVDSIIQYDLWYGFKQRTSGFHEDPWDLSNGNDDFEWTSAGKMGI